MFKLKSPAPSANYASASSAAKKSDEHVMLNGKPVIAAETSSFKTVDFSQDPSLILYSGGLSQCLVVFIKNRGESGKYDDVVTMMHFFPNNASCTDFARENFELGFNEFREKCAGKMKDVSVTIVGGVIYEGQDPNDSIRAALIEGVEAAIQSYAQGSATKAARINIHEKSVIKDPTKTSNIVFISKDGTAIIQNEELITPEIASMPALPELMDIHHQYIAIETGLPSFTLKRSEAIGRKAAKNPEEKITMESARIIFAEFEKSSVGIGVASRA